MKGMIWPVSKGLNRFGMIYIVCLGYWLKSKGRETQNPTFHDHVWALGGSMCAIQGQGIWMEVKGIWTGFICHMEAI